MKRCNKLTLHGDGRPHPCVNHSDISETPCPFHHVTCGQRWVAEIELCPRCGLNALAHIEEFGNGNADQTASPQAV